jgi:hypothetical protein
VLAGELGRVLLALPWTPTSSGNSHVGDWRAHLTQFLGDPPRARAIQAFPDSASQRWGGSGQITHAVSFRVTWCDGAFRSRLRVQLPVERCVHFGSVGWRGWSLRARRFVEAGAASYCGPAISSLTLTGSLHPGSRCCRNVRAEARASISGAVRYRGCEAHPRSRQSRPDAWRPAGAA